MIAFLLAGCVVDARVPWEVGGRTRVSDPGVDGHHATVAWSPAGEVVVAWTEGPLGMDAAQWLAQVTPGVARPPWRRSVGDGLGAAKGDVAVDDEGRVRLAFQTAAAGVWLAGGSLDDDGLAWVQVASPERAPANCSPDLALMHGLGPRVVWYDRVQGAIRGAALDQDLRPEPGWPDVVAEVGAGRLGVPDVAVAPDGSAVVAFTDQSATPRRLGVRRVAASGEVAATWWTTDPVGRAVNRPTVAVDEVGQVWVVFRTEADDAPPGIALAGLDPGGRPLAWNAAAWDGADQPVLATLGDAGLFVAVGSAGAIEAGVYYGGPDVQPERRGRVSSAHVAAARPHVAARETGPGSWDVAISYEVGPVGRREVWIDVVRVAAD